MKLMQNGYRIDFTHTINHLSFGSQEDQVVINRRYGGAITNELNGKEMMQEIPFGQMYVNYYLDITEEEYTDTTYKVEKKSEETGETTQENPIFIGFPYRSMH